MTTEAKPTPTEADYAAPEATEPFSRVITLDMPTINNGPSAASSCAESTIFNKDATLPEIEISGPPWQLIRGEFVDDLERVTTAMVALSSPRSRVDFWLARRVLIKTLPVVDRLVEPEPVCNNKFKMPHLGSQLGSIIGLVKIPLGSRPATTHQQAEYPAFFDEQLFSLVHRAASKGDRRLADAARKAIREPRLAKVATTIEAEEHELTAHTLVLRARRKKLSTAAAC